MAAAERVGDARLDLRVRQPGRRRTARRPLRQRADHAAGGPRRRGGRRGGGGRGDHRTAAPLRSGGAGGPSGAGFLGRAEPLEQAGVDRVEERRRAGSSRSAPCRNRRRACATYSRSCARVSPTKNSRRSSAIVVLGRRARPGRRSGSSPSSQPTRNTTGNSRPLAACRVSSVTASARGSSASTSAPVASCGQERVQVVAAALGQRREHLDGRPHVARARRAPAPSRWRREPFGQHLPGQPYPGGQRPAEPVGEPQLAGDRRHAGPVPQPVVRALLHRDAGPGQRVDDRPRPARRCGTARRCRRRRPGVRRSRRSGRSRASGATGRRPGRRPYGRRSRPRRRRSGRVAADQRRLRVEPGRVQPAAPDQRRSARSPAPRRPGSARDER